MNCCVEHFEQYNFMDGLNESIHVQQIMMNPLYGKEIDFKE